MPTVIALYLLSIVLIDLIEGNSSSDFNDLGRQLIGGFVAAVIIAVAFAFIKLRMRDKNPPAPFISITASKNPDEAAKGVND
jgi:high-affinity Fe2+/Pb2+ permease